MTTQRSPWSTISAPKVGTRGVARVASKFVEAVARPSRCTLSISHYYCCSNCHFETQLLLFRDGDAALLAPLLSCLSRLLAGAYVPSRPVGRNDDVIICGCDGVGVFFRRPAALFRSHQGREGLPAAVV